MTRSTVDGRPVFMRHTRFGWQVRWGRTAIALCRTWQEALDEIIRLYQA